MTWRNFVHWIIPTYEDQAVTPFYHHVQTDMDQQRLMREVQLRLEKVQSALDRWGDDVAQRKEQGSTRPENA